MINKTIKVFKIKTWDKLVEEFGTTYNNSINMDVVMSESMESDLPKNRIIKVECSKDTLKWSLENKFWYISYDMIEEELDINDYPEYFI
jgi:hypothetical protein